MSAPEIHLSEGPYQIPLPWRACENDSCRVRHFLVLIEPKDPNKLPGSFVLARPVYCPSCGTRLPAHDPLKSFRASAMRE